MDDSTKEIPPSINVKPLEGNLDYSHWGRNARASMVRHDPLLLGLESAPLDDSAAQQRGRNKANAIPKCDTTLMLSQAVQFRIFGYYYDQTKTAHELGQFCCT